MAPIRIGGEGGIVRPMFRTLAISATGLSAQRSRLEAIAENIANAQVTRTEDGGPYRRKFVRLESNPLFQLPGEAGAVDGAEAEVELIDAAGVRIAAIEEDATEGPMVYDPGHPDADEAGYVRYPNVDISTEMVDMMEARRVYQANATVFQTAKSMIRQALDI